MPVQFAKTMLTVVEEAVTALQRRIKQERCAEERLKVAICPRIALMEGVIALRTRTNNRVLCALDRLTYVRTLHIALVAATPALPDFQSLPLPSATHPAAPAKTQSFALAILSPALLIRLRRTKPYANPHRPRASPTPSALETRPTALSTRPNLLELLVVTTHSVLHFLIILVTSLVIV